MTPQELSVAEKNLKNASAREIVLFAVKTFGKNIGFSTSLSYEDQALTEIICSVSKELSIFTLDTGRLFQETYNTIQATEKHFGIQIEILFPEQKLVEKMVQTKGINLFYDDVENRKECCHVRKTLQLKRALKGKKAWITGLRREQSVTRFAMKKIEWDEANQIVKINPLADWTEQQTIDFVKSNNIPYNPLQDNGYRSIGCLPCTRPVGKDDDVRAGRWWWETPESKECGLHK